MEKSVILLIDLFEDCLFSVILNCGTHIPPTNLYVSLTILLKTKFKNTNIYILINLKG